MTSTSQKQFRLPLLITLGIIAFVCIITLFRLPPKVVKSSPLENGLLNPYLPIELVLDKNISVDQIKYQFEPNISTGLTFNLRDKTLIITPQDDNFPGEATITLKISAPFTYTLTFSTAQITETAPGWNDAFKKQDQDYVDQYGLRDKTLQSLREVGPIIQDTFRLDYNPGDGYYIITLQKPYEKSREVAQTWLNQHGLSDIKTFPFRWVEK